ncbi:MAG: UDP-N-acetylmuramate:L-alanyl-gamma-D-glutamyl-meso-diaminopimelate ligase [Thermodesulfobacteriota bacterium]
MLAPEQNRIPDNVRRVHLIAACGTAMAALACMLQELGYAVTGSDRNVYPPMSVLLADRGIAVASGFSGDNLAYGPDLVVVGNAVSRDNPEVIKTGEMNLPYCSMPQAINHFAAAGRKILMVCGTHGKTTTSSLLAGILHSAGFDPSFVIGGVVKDFGGNYRLGKGPHMVIEGDEYDTAFFDKGSKFLHYPAVATILTSVEFDHADIFADLDAVKKSFDRLLSGLPSESTVFAFDDDKNIDELVGNRSCRIVRYGRKEDSDWRLGRVTARTGRTDFEIIRSGRLVGEYTSPLSGRHNLYNALAAFACAEMVGVPHDAIGRALAGFGGVKRRQEVRGIKNGITVMDDFAHHPTAVTETLAGIRSFYPDARLIAVFEPRTNTSMRNVFQAEYARAFDAADLVCVSRPPLPEKVPEGQRFSSDQLAADLAARGKEAHVFKNADEIVDFLVPRARPGDLILVMSNGGFDNIHEKLLSRL